MALLSVGVCLALCTGPPRVQVYRKKKIIIIIIIYNSQKPSIALAWLSDVASRMTELETALECSHCCTVYLARRLGLLKARAVEN